MGKTRFVEHTWIAAALGALLWLVAMPEAAGAAVCGGTVVCQCGDTVTSNYTMKADLGPVRGSLPARPSGSG